MSPRHQKWLPLAVLFALFALTISAFWPALDAEFLDWDDNLTIVQNPHLRGLDLGTVQWAFTNFRMGHYQPLSWLSLAADRAMWGLDPRGFHATNLLLHVLSTLLVFRIVLLVLRICGPPEDRSRESFVFRVALSGLAAALWAVHPQRVESVVWVTERRDVLSALLLLLALWFYLRSRAPAPWNTLSPRVGMVLCSLAFALSLLAKAGGVVFAPMLLIIDFVLLGRVQSLVDWRQVLRLIVEKLPLLLLSAVVVFVAPRASASTGAMVPWDTHPLTSRIHVAVYGLWYYLSSHFAFDGFSPLYELPTPVVGTATPFAFAWFAILLLAVALLIAVRRFGVKPPALLLLYAMPLLPVLGFLQSGPQLVADRYSYLPGIVFVAVLAWLAQRWLPRRPVIARWMAVLVVLLILLFAASTFRYSEAWKTTSTLWAHAVEQDRECAYCLEGLAIARLAEGQEADAVQLFSEALVLRPNLFKANAILATLLERLQQPRAARDRYLHAYRVRPDQLALLRQAARISSEIDDHAAAAELWQRVLARQPGDRAATKRWYEALAASGRCGALSAAIEAAPIPDEEAQRLLERCE